MEITQALKTWKNVFGNWRYILLAVFIAVFFYSLNVLISSWRILAGFYSSYGFIKTVNLFFALFFGFKNILATSSFIILISISILFAMLFTLLIYKSSIHISPQDKEVGIIGGIGVFLSAFVPGCATCGIGLASVLGLSAGFLSFLPYGGIELSLVALAILVTAIFKTTKNMYVCKIPRAFLNKKAREKEEMSDEIKISKKNLWMYSTIILLAVVIVGGVLMFSGGNNNTTGNSTTGTGNVNLDAFTSNPSLYPSLGPDDAKNVVIEFSDFQCPYCAMASGLPNWLSSYQTQYGDLIASAQKIQKMAEDGKLKLVYVSMSFLGQESVYSAEAALCANEQGKFWEMHDAIFAAHDSKENNGKYSKDNLKQLAKGIQGLDLSKFNGCLDNDKELSAVQTVASQARTAATGTPTFYVNGQKVSASWSQLSAALG